MSALRFDNVTIRLGGRDILSAASFDIEDGEFVGMLGANGAGKTTLMRAALGLVPVASGAIARARPAGHARQRPYRLHAAEPRRRSPGFRLTGWDVVATAAIGAPLRLRQARQGDAARDRLGARPGRRARPRPPLDRRTVGRRAPARAAQPGAARQAAPAAARRAADLARSGASEETSSKSRGAFATTSRSRSCSAPTSSIRWSTPSTGCSISAAARR